MKTWVISDTHFGHEKLVSKYQVRPADFPERILSSWKRLVGPEDLVIHLGDLIVGKEADWISLLKELPGRKVLVTGNHDKRNCSWYMDNGFDFCCTSFVLYKFGLKILFSHIPVLDGDFDLNVHGHLHNGRHREITTGRKHFLVSLEDLGYHPLRLKFIVELWKKNTK